MLNTYLKKLHTLVNDKNNNEVGWITFFSTNSFNGASLVVANETKGFVGTNFDKINNIKELSFHSVKIHSLLNTPAEVKQYVNVTSENKILIIQVIIDFMESVLSKRELEEI